MPGKTSTSASFGIRASDDRFKQARCVQSVSTSSTCNKPLKVTDSIIGLQDFVTRTCRTKALRQFVLFGLSFVSAGCATVAKTSSSIGMAMMLWPAVLVMTGVSIPLMPYYLAVEGMPDRRGGEFAKFMPDGDHLLVAYKHGRNCHLYRVSLNGREWKRLTDGNRFDFDPAFSPDGKQVVFASRIAPRTSNLFIMDLDSGNLRGLTYGRRGDWSPRFSPDGKRIVFCSYADRKQSDLFAINTDGSGLVQLTNDKNSHDVCPRFLSDSATIVFARGDWWGHCSPVASSSWHSFDLYEIDMEGTPPERLTRQCFYDIEALMVDPDESHVLVVACDTVTSFSREPSGSLTDTGNKLTCTDYDNSCGKRVDGFAPSPDGKQLAFSTSDWDLPDARENAIHIAPFGTLDATVILESEHPLLSPEFSPDGRRIVYRTETYSTSTKTKVDIWIANSDGTNPYRVDDVVIERADRAVHPNHMANQPHEI